MEELETWVVAGLIKRELLKDGLHLGRGCRRRRG